MTAMTEPTPERDQALAQLIDPGPAGGVVEPEGGADEVRQLGGDVVRRVEVDTYALMADLGGGRQHATAARGELIAVSAEEAARGEELGALVDPSAPAAEEEEGAGGLPSDDELRRMTAEQLVGYAGQHPDEVDRIVALERERDRPRKTVLELAELTPDEDDGTQDDGAQ